MGQQDNKTPSPGNGRKWASKREPVSWSMAGAETLRDVVSKLTDNGCGIMLSRTSDGGALVIGIYAGNDRSKEYITEPGDILACLKWAVETYG